MNISVKNRSTKYHSEKYHKAYGIQKWLISKGFCISKKSNYKVDQEEYKSLLREFAIYDNPDFNFSGCKINNLESYIQNRFNKFCSFVCNKYNKYGNKS